MTREKKEWGGGFNFSSIVCQVRTLKGRCVHGNSLTSEMKCYSHNKLHKAAYNYCRVFWFDSEVRAQGASLFFFNAKMEWTKGDNPALKSIIQKQS